MDATPQDAAAVLVLRGDQVESRHRVSYALAEPSGALVDCGGDPSTPVFPRSGIKPIQALAMVESGAAETFAVTDLELALACGSHAGEPAHVEAVLTWLARLGLDESALACGPHFPFDPGAAERLRRAGVPPAPIYNNCSGKHAGMLTLARYLEAPLSGYVEPGHPVQQRIASTLGDVAGVELSAPAIDGCSVPTWRLPLGSVAAAFARLIDPGDLPASRAAACRRIVASMTAHPEMVAGTTRACTRIMQAVPGLLAKSGAEGVYLAALTSHRVGLALKVEDGAPRAAPVALIALLNALGVLDDAARQMLADLARPTLRNHTGKTVGAIRPVEHWPSLTHTGKSRA